VHTGKDLILVAALGGNGDKHPLGGLGVSRFTEALGSRRRAFFFGPLARITGRKQMWTRRVGGPYPTDPSPLNSLIPLLRRRPITEAVHALCDRLINEITHLMAIARAGIDDRLDQANEFGAPDPLSQARIGLIEPLRNVYGISDKVLAMALSGILIGAADVRPRWLEEKLASLIALPLNQRG
jgi:hypothetical protein